MGLTYHVVGISEIDKYAVKAYNAIHGETPNYGDICKIDWHNVPNFDLFTYSFPCNDISIAGKMKGFDNGSGTRSSLLWECAKAIEIKRPDYLLMENVKNLVSKKFLPYFLQWQQLLEELGYTNFTKVLNAKHYGVPQNRERIFMVSTLDGKRYQFPQQQEVTTSIKDILEEEVDLKYYLSDKLLNSFIRHAKRHNEKKNGFGFKVNDIEKSAKCISTSPSRSTSNYIKVAGNLDIRREDRSRVYDTNGISPTINTCSGTNQTKILQLNPSKESGGVQPYQQNRVYDIDGLLPTVTTTNSGKVSNRSFIRRLTPKECFRLMGVTDIDFEKLKDISDTQLYKLSGNSIVVPVLEEIFKNLFAEQLSNCTKNQKNDE